MKSDRISYKLTCFIVGNRDRMLVGHSRQTCKKYQSK